MKISNKTKSSGAIFIELVASIPLILLLIGAIIFISEMISAISQLRLAVTEGPRLAITRGNSLFNYSTAYKTVNSDIEFFVQDAAHRNGDLPAILYSGVSEADAKNFYNTPPTQWYRVDDVITSADPISMAHTIDIYALAYTYGMLRLGIPGIKYPCNPNDSTASDGLGCVICQVSDPLPYFGDPCPTDDGAGGPPHHPSCPFDRANPDVGVICKYHPAGATSRMVDRMIRFFSRGNGGLPELFLTASTYPAGIDEGGGGVGGT